MFSLVNLHTALIVQVIWIQISLIERNYFVLIVLINNIHGIQIQFVQKIMNN